MRQSWVEPEEQFCSTNGWRRGSVEVYTRKDGLSPKFSNRRERGSLAPERRRVMLNVR